MHTGQQLHTKVINFIPFNFAWLSVFQAFCNQISQFGDMVDINGLRCYIQTEIDCCETGDNPSLKVLMKN